MKSRAIASALTYAGAVPFVAGALLVLTGNVLPLQVDVQLVLRAYSALIVSFLAGIHWQIGLSEPNSPRHLLMTSNAFALAAWVTVFIEVGAAAWTLFAVLFAGLLMLDRRLLRRGLLPPWFYRLRFRITMIVVVVLLCTAAISLVDP